MKKYLIELGNEGVIVSMRLRELIKNLNWEKEMVLKDYFKDYVRIGNLLKTMNFNFLIETSNLSRTLFGELHDKMVVSKGRRLLSKANLLDKDIILLMKRYKTLDNLFGADKESLNVLLKNQNVVDMLISDLENLEERIRAGKKV
jgi:DNA integrity scanning protein DisA with diadenylate cyclase activity